MRLFPIVFCSLAAVGCATTPVPNKRPVTPAAIAAIGTAPAVVLEANDGIGKSWFMQDSSAAGASYGLIGAMVTVTMDAIANAGPARQARKSADTLAEVVSVDQLTQSLTAAMAAETAAPAAAGIHLAGVETRQPIVETAIRNNAVEIAPSYVLAEDASALKFVATVTLTSDAAAYATPYTFEGTPPKAELSGPVYRNTFNYQSAALPVPVLTEELRARLIASIEASFRDADGNLPAADSNDGKAYARELEKAKDDTLSKAETAIFLTREWVKDDGALLWQELEAAHRFLAQYLRTDLADAAVPALDGTDEIVETAADGRTVRKIGQGVAAGSYVSTAGGAEGFVTYGNAISIGEVHMDRATTLKKSAKE